MSKILEMFVHLTTQERELLMFEYKDEMAVKFALSQMIDKEIEKKCEQIGLSDSYIYRNTILESDDSENEAS